MSSSFELAFKIIFDQATEPKALLSTCSPEFSILFANKAFASFTGRDIAMLLGHPLADILGSDEIPGTVTLIRNGLSKIAGENTDSDLPLFQYRNAGSEKEISWWKARAERLTNEAGEVVWLVFTVLDNITLHNQSNVALQAKQKQLTEELKDTQDKLIRSEADLQTSDRALTRSKDDLKLSGESLLRSEIDLAAANEEIRETNVRLKDVSESDYRLSRIVNTTPIGLTIFKGRELFVEIANQAIANIWGRQLEDVVGKPLLSVFPELDEQPFPKLMYNVLDTGKSLTISDEPVLIVLPDGTTKNIYVDFSYDALLDTDGKPDSILVSVRDVTEIVETRQLVQTQRDELEAMNEEMAASNEEMYALNEELTAGNEEIRSINEDLEKSRIELESVYNQMVRSEGIFRGLFDQSPLAIGLLRGKDLIIEEVNDNMLTVWGRRREEVQGLPFRKARPELEGQPFMEYLYKVYHTGKTFRYTEQKGRVLRNGEPYDGFFSGVYQPIKNEKGETEALLVIIEEVTEDVVTRRRMETLREEYDQAVSTANLAPWSIDIKTGHLYMSKELRTIFGLAADRDITIEDAMPAIEAEYHPMIREVLYKGLVEYQSCDIEIPLTNMLNNQKLWVRVTGKVFFNADGSPAQFAGVFADITERRKDEQRKNDFIGMVSHELKTPLTSLSGYLQMMQLGAGGMVNEFQARMLDKASRQISKMTRMINGFLNISRLEAGKIQIDKSRFDMALLMKEEESETSATYTSHTFIFEPVETTFVSADRDKILQVVNNFISNAVKYSLPGTTIQVACVTVNGMAQVSVKDEGNGISSEDRDKIFDRYYRVKDGRNTAVAGFGIGLYLCYEIIQRHNGSIWLESEPGKGSTFYFTLPLDELQA